MSVAAVLLRGRVPRPYHTRTTALQLVPIAVLIALVLVQLPRGLQGE